MVKSESELMVDILILLWEMSGVVQHREVDKHAKSWYMIVLGHDERFRLKCVGCSKEREGCFKNVA